MVLLPILVPNRGLPDGYRPLQDALIHGFAMTAALSLPLPDPFKAWSVLGLGLCTLGQLLPVFVRAPSFVMAGPVAHFLGLALLGLAFVTWLGRNFSMQSPVQVMPPTVPMTVVAQPPPPREVPTPVPPPALPAANQGQPSGGGSGTGRSTDFDAAEQKETELKLAELTKDLAFLEELDRALMTCVPAQVLILASNLRVKLCNNQFREFFRLSVDEEAGKDLNGLIPNKELLKAVQETIGKKDVRELEFRHYVKKVGEKRLLARVFGAIEGLVIVCLQELFEVSDASASRLPKTQIINVQSEKLQLAGGLFDDLESSVVPILDQIRNVVDSLQSSSDVQGRVREALGQLQGQVMTLRRLFTTFQKFAEQHLDVAEQIPIVSVVDEALDPKNYPFDLAGISITKDFGLKRPKVEANEKQIKQAFINLFTNAFEAIRRTGAKGEIIIKLEEEAGRVRVSIGDDGGGIPHQHLKDIFKGKFSTKAGGAGLGLVTALRIVQGSKGHISVESEEGSGSIFVVEMLAV